MSTRRYETITYHPHALNRMARRKISKNQVERALNNSTANIYTSEGKLVAEVTTQMGATLRLVFVELAPKSAFVITTIRIGN